MDNFSLGWQSFQMTTYVEYIVLFLLFFCLSINFIEISLQAKVLYSAVFAFILTDQPSITSISADQTVKVGDMVWLNCTADSFPPENITWTKLSTNRIIVRMPLNIAGKQDEGFYTCTADNGVGNPATADVFIAVHCKYQYCYYYFCWHTLIFIYFLCGVLQ